MATDNKNKSGKVGKKATGATAKSAPVKKSASKSAVSTSSKRATSGTKPAQKKSGQSAAKSVSKKTETTKKTTTSTKTNASGTKKNVKKKGGSTAKTNTIKIKENKAIEITPEIVKELHVEEEVVKSEQKSASKGNKFEIKSFLGENLPIELTNEARGLRKKSYVKDAVFFAAVVSVLDLFAMIFIKGYPHLLDTMPWINYAVTMLFDFVLVFIFTYVIDYLIVENAISKNN